MVDKYWSMFLDDERFPISPDYVIVRTSTEAINLVKTYGMPQAICFDHDLGHTDTSMIFLKWLSDQLLDGALVFPESFVYSVHSQNPVGAKNIRLFMEDLLEHFKERV